MNKQTDNNGNYPSNTELEAIMQKYGTVIYEDDGITVKGVFTSEKGYKILIADIGTSNISNETQETVAFEVNLPKLATGMKGIYWDELGNEVEVTTANKSKWYNYTNKKWANAKTSDGSYFVWIPRYEYKITTPHTSTAQTIEVNFIEGINTQATSGYMIHPAFSFGAKELEGIWVAKFEASGTSSSIDIKPNVVSLRSMTIGSMFSACRTMETNSKYGWGTTGTEIDTHMMKNTEWGAVSYLSSSQYGKDGEIWNNPNSNYTTGQAGASSGVNYTTSTFTYNTANGVNASTTGNIYGIYDMSGGVWEYTASYVNSGDPNLNTYGASLVSADIKYKDVYTSSTDTSKRGDSIYETSTGAGTTAWYTDYSYIPGGTQPFFIRGGGYADQLNSGIFAYTSLFGYDTSWCSFRPVVTIEN